MVKKLNIHLIRKLIIGYTFAMNYNFLVQIDQYNHYIIHLLSVKLFFLSLSKNKLFRKLLYLKI